jgi:ketosteroid isomerase-like protein
VDSEWNHFISRCQQALGDLVQGRPGPFKALWSHADDVVIMGAFGGYEQGWDQVSARLDWAAAGIRATDRAAENIVTVIGEDLAYTVDLEHMTRHAGDQPQPRTLRCTQAYRRENGQWKVILRHADELPRKDEHQKLPTAPHHNTPLMPAEQRQSQLRDISSSPRISQSNGSCSGRSQPVIGQPAATGQNA